MQFQGKWLLPQSLHMEEVTGAGTNGTHPMKYRVGAPLRDPVSGRKNPHLQFQVGRGMLACLEMLLLQVLPDGSRVRNRSKILLNPNLLNNVCNALFCYHLVCLTLVKHNFIIYLLCNCLSFRILGLCLRRCRSRSECFMINC